MSKEIEIQVGLPLGKDLTAHFKDKIDEIISNKEIDYLLKELLDMGAIASDLDTDITITLTSREEEEKNIFDNGYFNEKNCVIVRIDNLEMALELTGSES